MDISVDHDEHLWSQKYRPKTVDECILPERIKTLVKSEIAKGECPHFLFSGGAGMGKTTLAYAIANELGSDVMYINASMENGIDVLRTKIQSFASTVSLSDTGPKIVIMDEADGITPIMQGALKGFLETFSANCRFIFTCNIKHKIIEPIQSRCSVVDFSYNSTEKPKIAAAFYRRVADILSFEKVDFEPKAVAKLVERNFPDFRKTLNELQKASASGNIGAEILIDHSSDNINDLVKLLKENNFNEMRKWVAQNEDIEPAIIFRGIYDIAKNTMKANSLAELILILADYGYKSAFCLDQQINTTACMLEIMSRCKWD